MISVITKMETLGYNFKSADEQSTMEIFINGSTLLDLNNHIVDKTIAIRKSKKKLPDAIIAATAIIYYLTLISRNNIDFKNIDGLLLIKPFEI